MTYTYNKETGEYHYIDPLEAIAKEIDGEYIGTWYLEDEPYQFYDLAVIRVVKGFDKQYYISTDSGCSCPTPFDSHTADYFTGPLTKEQVIEEYKSLANTDGQYGALSAAAFEESLKTLEAAL